MTTPETRTGERRVVRVPGGLSRARLFPPSALARGEVFTIESRVLLDNPLGDPTRREVAVVRPPSGKTAGLPLVLFLSGFTGAGPLELRGERPFHETLFQVFDRLVRSGEVPEAVLVSPDAMTVLGGSQYMNSVATGRYADFVVSELLPWARGKFGTRSVGVIGQSSGGFGALHLALEYPGTFAAVGSSAGDMAFEYCYLGDFPKAARGFRKFGGPDELLRRFADDPSPIARDHLGSSGAAMNVLAMASCYSPAPAEVGGFELPFEIDTGEIRPAVWERWLAFDPARRVETAKGANALRRLHALHVTGSMTDEFMLDAGARIFTAAAKRSGVPVTHAEFEGGHFDRTPRFESILRTVLPALAAEPP